LRIVFLFREEAVTTAVLWSNIAVKRSSSFRAFLWSILDLTLVHKILLSN